MAESDPRVYFAAERTLLAWVRTGMGVIGLGFVVARFGLFLEMLHASAASDPSIPQEHAFKLGIGVAFILLGALGIGIALTQFLRFSATLPAESKPAHYVSAAAVGYSALLALAGVVLAVYLLLQVG